MAKKEIHWAIEVGAILLPYTIRSTARACKHDYAGRVAQTWDDLRKSGSVRCVKVAVERVDKIYTPEKK